MNSRLDVNNRLIDRAAKDEDFRTLLLEDPQKAIQEETGITIPSNFELVVHEETQKSFHLVLPATERLSESDLALIAGGTCDDGY